MSDRDFFGLRNLAMELDDEIAAFTDLGLNEDVAAKAFDGSFYDGQADASSGGVGVCAGPLEHFEDGLMVSLGNTNAAIFDVDFTEVGGFADKNVYFGRLVFAGKFYGVAQQVGKNLNQQRAVGLDGGQGCLNLDLCTGPFDVAIEHAQTFLQDVLDGDGFVGMSGHAHLAEFENVFDEGVHHFGGAKNLLGEHDALFV